jgi:pyruvate,orthophosphate dikinase
MDTVLNLGLNDVTVEALAAGGRPRFAYDSTAASSPCIQRGARHRAPPFRGGPRRVQGPPGLQPRHDLTAGRLEGARPRYKGIVEKELGKALPAGAARAALGRRRAVFGSWMNNRAIKYRELHAHSGELGARR